MDREEVRQEIRGSWRQILQSMTGPAKRQVNGETSYICPLCGHGKGGDGLTRNPCSVDGNGLKCFGCGFSGDIISLYRQKTGADYNSAISLLAQKIGIDVDSYRLETDSCSVDGVECPQNALNGQGGINTPLMVEASQNGLKSPLEAMVDYTSYYRECRQRITDPVAVSYLQQRGISMETAEAYWIGYDPEADPANAPGAGADVQKQHPCPRLIIPTSVSHYVARRVDGETEYKALNPTGSTPSIFNGRILYAQEVQEVFVTEGIFDALSVIEAGAAAIAINSAVNAEALVRQLEEHRTAATLILCLDNDPQGERASETIRAGLQRLNISYIVADICGGYKDPNEYLTSDRVAFVEAVERAQRQIALKPDNTVLYMDAFMSDEIERFKDDKKTGFRNLDAQAGGLYSGLYVLAAISSLGKTSFALQLADQLAEHGNDVIFFSLEQSKLELVSKSLARRTAQKDFAAAVTSLSIRKGYLPQQVLDAVGEYREAVADRISIVEGNFDCNISFIGNYIRQYVRRNGTRPVVFIDYLQILQPVENTRRQSTKETVDNTVTELKRISRELDLTMIVISSVNRANYMQPIDFESLKESGSIEFTADVIWGLQLQCLNDPAFDRLNNIKERRAKIKEAKAAIPRKIELCCLKNRYGISNFSAFFDYYPANDLFVEQTMADFGIVESQKRAGRRL